MNRSLALLVTMIGLAFGFASLFYALNVRNTLGARNTELEGLLNARPATGVGAAVAPAAGDSTAEARLQDQVNYLTDQIDLLQQENARLIRQIDRMQTGGGDDTSGEPRAFTEDEIKTRTRVEELVASIREIPFKQAPDYAFADWDGMRLLLSDTLRPKRDSDAAERQSRAAGAMGFVPAGIAIEFETTNLLANQLGAALKGDDNRIYLNKSASFGNLHDRTALSVELAQLLTAQNYGVGKLLDGVANNDDAHSALRALTVGDAHLVKIHFMLQDSVGGGDDLQNSPTALSKDEFQAVPAFIREYFEFPYKMGAGFCRKLHEKGRWDALAGAYRKPPGSTAEILHPELYLADKPFTPEAFEVPAEKLKLGGAAPYWNNVAGELGISIYLNRAYFLDEMRALNVDEGEMEMPPMTPGNLRDNPASLAAAGWNGDRYFVWANGENPGDEDHYAWLSAWSSADDSAEFYEAMQKALGQRYKLPRGAAAKGNAVEFAKPRHVMLVHQPDTRRVVVLDAHDAETLVALKKAFLP